MEKLNVREAKTQLSKYLSRIEAGESFVLCRRNVPIAEMRPLAPDETASRRPEIGFAKGTFSIPDGLFEPQPC